MALAVTLFADFAATTDMSVRLEYGHVSGMGDPSGAPWPALPKPVV